MTSDLGAFSFGVHLFMKFLIYYVNNINVTKEGKSHKPKDKADCKFEINRQIVIYSFCTVLQ